MARRRIKVFPEDVMVFAETMQKGLWVFAFGPGVPIPVLMRVGKSESGQLACTGLLVGFDFDYKTTEILSGSKVELSARRLQQIRIGELLDAVTADPFFAKALGEVPKVRGGRRRRPGPHPSDDERLREAREALEVHDALRAARRGSPYPEMARRLGVSEATARRRVQRAIALGLDKEEA
jgi:hypothetical protein